MKKILGIHPVLIIVLVIFLGLSIVDWLGPKTSVDEKNDRVVSSTSETVQNDKTSTAAFHDLNQPVDTDIQLFNHEKWYKPKVTVLPSKEPATQPTQLAPQNKQVFNTNVPVVTMPVSPVVKTEIIKKVVTKDQAQDKTDIKVIAKPTKPVSDPVIKPQTQAASEKAIPPEIAKHVAMPSDINVKYLGKYTESDRQYVFLEVNGDNRAVALGNMVDGDTKVSAIEQDRVQLTNIRTGVSKTLNTQ